MVLKICAAQGYLSENWFYSNIFFFPFLYHIKIREFQ
jgi:hypothetical protein